MAAARITTTARQRFIYDEPWVLGDLVNYGPNPAETIDFVRSHASMVIRGNHDNSVGFGADCGCSVRFRAMAEAIRQYTTSVLSAGDKRSCGIYQPQPVAKSTPDIFSVPRNPVGSAL
jgi:Calcineurin-like phosphoesterase